MRRRVHIWFIALFFAALVLPFPLFWLLQGGLDTSNHENRALTTWQDVAEAPWREKTAVFEDMLGDHAAFRNQFMTLNAAFNYRLFGTVQSSEVLLGREEWLFYKNVSDSRSLDDYQGLNPYSPAQLDQIAADLSALQQLLAQRGVQLVLLVAPIKEGVYSDYMPAGVPQVGATKAQLLVQHLQENTSVPVVFPQAELREAAGQVQVYYKQDTHWNGAGALVACRALQAALGQDVSAFDGVRFVPGGAPKRDLADISATYTVLKPDSEVEVQGFLEQNTLQGPVAEDEMGYRMSAACPQAQGSLVMLRDSFGEGMIPYLSKCYESSLYLHINAFDEAAVDGLENCVFVFELAERNTDRLLDYLPRMLEWAAG